MKFVKIITSPYNEIVYINPSAISDIKPDKYGNGYTLFFSHPNHNYSVNDKELQKIIDVGNIQLI